MTDKKYALTAETECTSAKTTAHHGGAAGRPFWNAQASQFMYVPAFQFQPLPGFNNFRYKAKDENGSVHAFDADNAHALLTPIWKDIPAGVVSLSVYALNDAKEEAYQVGSRTFCKLAPFSDDLAPAAYSYKEALHKAYDYIMSQRLVTHWLEGTPDPEYGLNSYPSKMISAIITSMIRYARFCPEEADKALKIAVNSADYLIDITPQNGPCKGIPPTYKFDFRSDKRTDTLPFSSEYINERQNWVMFIYPPEVGSAYLELEEATGEKRFLDAAIAIGEYLLSHVEKNGTWFLIRDIRTDEVLAPDYCEPLEKAVPFLMELYKRTKEKTWKELADRAIAYVENTTLENYSWGAQFEDSVCSVNYSNITHYAATALIRYYCEYFADDENKMAVADDLMRFVEDQFVVWKKPSPFNRLNLDTSIWPTPCVLEQYSWYLPIDASLADVSKTFLAMYKAGRGELHREKAKALVDTLTRIQNEKGLIPTTWTTEQEMDESNIWINCMISSMRTLSEFSEFFEE